MTASTFSAIEAAPRMIGGWRVERRLGAGAMGEVLLAVRDGQRAALKIVAKRLVNDEAFQQRFQREIAALSGLDHPHVARALDRGEQDGQPWLAMEFVDGPDLDGMLQKAGAYFEAEILQLAIQLARGLEHVHGTAGMIHRDVKPANILIARAPGGDPARLLNPGDLAKIIDFGLARPVEPQEGNGLTMAGMIMGTPNYIAPEQISCERNLGPQVDMYALGATMFHLLTGRVPFVAGSAAAVMAAHLNDPVPDPGDLVPAISEPTRRLVQTALAKKPGDRFADWRAFIAACEKSLAALGGNTSGSANRFIKRPMTKPPTTVLRKPPSSGEVAAVAPQRPASDVALAAALASSGPGSGSAALRAAVTSRIAKVPTDGFQRRSDSTVRTERDVRGSGDASAVHKWSGRLDVSGHTGGSVMPWIALGSAGLLAAAGVAWAVVG